MDKKNLHQKLIEVRKSVPYLKKENEGYQFKYVSSSQTLGAIREAMDKEGVLLVPNVVRATLTPKNAEQGQNFTQLEMTFTWVNVEAPDDKISCGWYGQGLDSGEKGVGKALTYAEKYFILKFFNIPTDKDDPDTFQEKETKEPKPVVKHTSTEVENEDGSRKITYAQEEGRPAGGCTEKQQKAIWAILKGHDMTDDDIKEKLFADYGVTHSRELTKTQASEIIDQYGRKS